MLQVCLCLCFAAAGRGIVSTPLKLFGNAPFEATDVSSQSPVFLEMTLQKLLSFNHSDVQ